MMGHINKKRSPVRTPVSSRCNMVHVNPNFIAAKCAILVGGKPPGVPLPRPPPPVTSYSYPAAVASLPNVVPDFKRTAVNVSNMVIQGRAGSVPSVQSIYKPIHAPVQRNYAPAPVLGHGAARPQPPLLNPFSMQFTVPPPQTRGSLPVVPVPVKSEKLNEWEWRALTDQFLAQDHRVVERKRSRSRSRSPVLKKKSRFSDKSDCAYKNEGGRSRKSNHRDHNSNYRHGRGRSRTNSTGSEREMKYSQRY